MPCPPREVLMHEKERDVTADSAVTDMSRCPYCWLIPSDDDDEQPSHGPYNQLISPAHPSLNRHQGKKRAMTLPRSPGVRPQRRPSRSAHSHRHPHIEDQQRINTFSKSNVRLRGIEGRFEALKVSLDLPLHARQLTTSTARNIGPRRSHHRAQADGQ